MLCVCFTDTETGKLGSNATTAAGAARAKREGGTAARDPQIISTRGEGQAASTSRRREVVLSEDPPAGSRRGSLIGSTVAADPCPYLDAAKLSAQGGPSSPRGRKPEPHQPEAPRQGQQQEQQQQEQQQQQEGFRQEQHVSVPVRDWPALLRLQASQHRATRRGYLRRRVSELVLAKVCVWGACWELPAYAGSGACAGLDSVVRRG